MKEKVVLLILLAIVLSSCGLVEVEGISCSPIDAEVRGWIEV